ncbi:ribonuclease H-like domain-containing protein [Tanacetum coccineum]
MNKKNLFLLKDMDQDSAHMVAASKVPMLKPENGATLLKITTVEVVVTVMPITTAKEKAQRRLEKLLEAIEKRFGGNEATRKTQRNLLKQQYENFTAPSSEMLDQTFDRLQKLVSQLELLDEKLSKEDVNQKLLRSLSPEWNTYVVVWRNKANLETMSMDDLYNNLKVYEPKVNGMSSSSSSTQNMAFVSSSNNNTSSTNEAVNTAHGVFTANIQVNAANFTNIDNLSDAVIYDMEEMDLRWEMAMLTMRARRFLKNSGRKLTVNGNEIIALVSSDGLGRYNWSDQAEEGPNYALMAFSSSSPDSEVSNDSICSKSCLETVELLKSQNDQLLKDLKESELMVLVPPPYTGNFMPPTPDLSFTGLDEFVNKPVVENIKVMSSKEEPKVVRKNDDAPYIEEWVSDDEEEDLSQPKTKKKTVRPSIVKKEFVKSKQQQKTARKTVKQVEQFRQNTHSLRGNQRNWNNMMSQKLRSNFEMFNKACYVCGSFYHLQINCNYHQNQRVNHQNFAKKTYPYAKKNLVPRIVLMKSGLVSVNTTRQVNVAHSKTTVNTTRPMSYLSKIAHSTVKRPIHKNTTFKNSNINQRFNTVRDKHFNTARPKAVVNAVKGNNLNAIKASACWVWKPKHKVLDYVSKHDNASIILKKFNYVDAQGRSKSDKGIIDSGCSRHMTVNMSYLTDYEEIDGGYVAFGGNPKQGKIIGKCTIKTVITDDYSRFTWVFFLATKDETSGILKSFITGIENLVDHKVKVIRCDNGTEFKNREMNQFCKMKGILRQFSAARTPQQNEVAERRNMTLIEVARTMLADSKLPTTFWAEAVNTA